MAQPEKLIQSYLVVLMQLADASVGAIFKPREHRRQLVAQVGLDQAAIDCVELVWSTQRSTLEARSYVKLGAAIVVQLAASRRSTGALLYLDRVQEGFPTGPQREIQKAMLEHLGHEEPAALRPALAQHGPDEGLREQMILALSKSNGIVAAAARLLGISRQTLYERAERLSIDVGAFRLR